MSHGNPSAFTAQHIHNRLRSNRLIVLRHSEKVFGESEEDVEQTYDEKYKNRLTFTGPLNDLSINNTHLTEQDCGVY